MPGVVAGGESHSLFNTFLEIASSRFQEFLLSFFQGGCTAMILNLESLGQPHSVALAVTQKVLGSAITLLSILGTDEIHHGGSTKR